MKNPKSKNRKKMEQTPVSISATVNEPVLLKNLVERLADRGFTMGYSLVKMQKGWQSFDASAVEAFVSVDIHLSGQEDAINMPFVTCYLFTCIKGKEGQYKLAWANSLS